jgi:hypothetical protein
MQHECNGSEPWGLPRNDALNQPFFCDAPAFLDDATDA